jgi:hypothetical protein
MPLNLDVQQLKSELVRSKARWQAEVTPLSHVSEVEKLRRLGAVPPPGALPMHER